MCYVYILRSLRNSKRYVGYTAKTVEERLHEHNVGKNQWTRRNGPFELIFTQEFSESKEAKQFEIFLKSGQGRQCLDELEKIIPPFSRRLIRLRRKLGWKEE